MVTGPEFERMEMERQFERKLQEQKEIYDNALAEYAAQVDQYAAESKRQQVIADSDRKLWIRSMVHDHGVHELMLAYMTGTERELLLPRIHTSRMENHRLADMWTRLLQEMESNE